MNIIGLSGRLTSEPELKTTQSGISVCQVNLAVKRPKVKDTTDFISVVLWRQQAEFLTRFAHKGSLVGVQGCLTSRKFQDKDGNNRTVFEVVADSVELLESKKADVNVQKDPLDDFSEVVDGMDMNLPF
jgi:single-strand DNA-binding protein